MSPSSKAIGLCTVAVLSTMASAFGQLSDADIAALKERGRQEGWTFTVEANPATQYPVSQLCGAVPPKDWEKTANFAPPMNGPNFAPLPGSWDWRTKISGGMPPIRNQGGCGSCWAFGSTGSLECNIKIKDGIDVDLSEQWLVSCNQSGWSCAGGWFTQDYFLRNGATDPCGGNGHVLELDFPYSGTNGTCACPYTHQYWIESWAYVNADVNSIKQAIMDYGPVAVTVHGGDSPFQGYHGGVYNACYAGTGIDHLVVLVGWDDAQGANGVWFLRNSWGPGWGESGYMRIQYGCNNVAQSVAYLNYAGRPGVGERVSVASDGTQGNAKSGNYPPPSVSADGRFVAFDSQASTLVSGDTNGKWDVFVRDRLTGTTERVSISSTGTQADGDSFSPVISPDGRYVAFVSTATNLLGAGGDTNGKYDVFLRDRQNGTTERVSLTNSGAQATGGDSGKRTGDSNTFVGAIALSADGRYVVFVSGATNLVSNDTNGKDDVFVRDRQAGATERVSLTSAGAQVTGHSKYVAISADGGLVAFTSAAADLVSGDTNNQDDVFLRDRQTNTTERVSLTYQGAQATGGACGFVSLCSDGHLIAFESNATNLVSGGTSNKQIFVRDRQAGTTECASVRTGSTTIAGSDSALPSLSADGRYVAFNSSASNLVASDTNNAQDVFVHDRIGDITTRVSLSASWTQGNGASTGGCLSGDGGYVAFASAASNLVAGDTNNVQDIFLHDCGASQALSTIADRTSLAVPEGGTASFRVKLNRQPTSNVNIAVSRVSGSNTINVQSGASLTFTTANWDTFQTVTLAADTDVDVCNDQATIRCATAYGRYTDMIVEEQDGDTLLVVAENPTVSIPEGGTAQLRVKLNHQPCDNLTVTVAPAGGSSITTVTSGGSLTFTTANWDTYQTATLASARDVNAYDDRTTIRCTSAGIGNTDVTAVQQDNGACDFDGDGDVDQEDFAYLQRCLSGTGVQITDPNCRNADLDCNGWADQTDIRVFLKYFNGPNKAPKTPATAP